LGIHDVFWCEKVFTAVVRGRKFYAVFGEFDVNIMFPSFGKGGRGDFFSVYKIPRSFGASPFRKGGGFPQSKTKYLKTSAIGKDESIVSVLESMESSGLFDEFASWAEVEVEGIGENQLYGFDVGSDIGGVFQ
jgi:hypothetical protein